MLYQKYTSLFCLLSNFLASTKNWSRGYKVHWNHWFKSRIWATVNEIQHIIFPVLKVSRVHVHTCAHTYTHAHTRTRSHAHTHRHTHTQTPPGQSLAWAHCVPHGARERDIKITLAKPTNNTANQDYSSRGEGCPNPWKPENRVSTIVENPFSNEGHQGHFPIKHRWHPVLPTLCYHHFGNVQLSCTHVLPVY